jgi:hypothetical protein
MNIRSVFGPPVTDAEYVEAVRESLAREKADGIHSLLRSIGFFILFFLVWFFFEWLTAIDEFPEFYYRRAAGLLFGIVGGALSGFGLFSLGAGSARRPVLQGSLALVVLSIALLMVFWGPSVIAQQIEGGAEKEGFLSGACFGMCLGYLLYVALQNAIWARQKLTGEHRAEQLMLKYYDELKEKTSAE